jgi:prepilin signal peptidase PulO-like enzyme (type II secretory pathway)
MGIVFVAAQRLRGRVLNRMDALPFGPFLCAAILVTWLVRAFA